MNCHYHVAEVVSVYDGDTITVDVDLDFHCWVHREKLRLLGIDAPEIRGETRPAGIASRDHLRQLIDGRKVVIETKASRKGKYGRYLATVWLQVEDRYWVNVNRKMVEDGFAELRDY